MIMTVTSMLDNVLRIATRQSPLALWQAHYVKDKLMASHPGLVVELCLLYTSSAANCPTHVSGEIVPNM